MPRTPPKLGPYLEWHRSKIRVTVPVPKALQPIIGKSRIKKPLNTDSPANANRLKHGIIAEVQKLLLHAEAQAARPSLRGEALDWFDMLSNENLPDDQLDSPLKLALLDRLDEIEAKKGEAVAVDFANIALGEATPLEARLDIYLATSGQAPRTKESVRRAVRVYQEWAESDGRPTVVERISRKVAGQFVTDHLLPRMDAVTVGTYTKFLSGYWRFLISKGFATENPWTNQLDGIKQRKKAQSLLLQNQDDANQGKRPYTSAEAATLLYAEPKSPTDRRSIDLAWIAALSGMRIEEICTLKVGHCTDGWFSVNHERRGKTDNAKRRVPIHPSLADLMVRRTANKGNSDYLIEDLHEPDFSSGRERSMPAVKAYGRFRKRCGVDERPDGQRQSNVDFHSWRRWFAQQAKHASNDIWVIADIMGHDTNELPLGITAGLYGGQSSDEAMIRCVTSIALPPDPSEA